MSSEVVKHEVLKVILNPFQIRETRIVTWDNLGGPTGEDLDADQIRMFIITEVTDQQQALDDLRRSFRIPYNETQTKFIGNQIAKLAVLGFADVDSLFGQQILIGYFESESERVAHQRVIGTEGLRRIRAAAKAVEVLQARPYTYF